MFSKLCISALSSGKGKALGMVFLLAIGSLLGLKVQETREELVPGSSLKSALPVKVQKAQRVSSYQVIRTYTGEVVPHRTSELGFELGGKLIEVLVREGQFLRKGFPLARLDTALLEEQEKELQAQISLEKARLAERVAGPRSQTIAVARASVLELEAQEGLLKRKKNRRVQLYREKTIPGEELDEVATGLRTCQARLEQARYRLAQLMEGTRKEQIQAQKALIDQFHSRLRQIQLRREKSFLRAPYNGIVGGLRVEVGTVVAPGQSIVRLLEASALEVRVGIPVDLSSALKTGTPQVVTLGGKIHGAKLLHLLPELDSSTRTVTAVLELHLNGEDRVFVGQMALWQVPQTLSASAFKIPTSALVRGNRGLWSCLVALSIEASLARSGHYRVEKRDIEILHQQGEMVLVRGELQPGDSVIVQGIHRVVVGQRVRPMGN